LFFLAGVLAVAFFYVGWMYLKDSRGVGPWWASLLGLLRSCVYVLLAFVFLLPSRQTFIETRSQGKVLVLFDVSGSMQTSDEQSTGGPERLQTRIEKVYELLADPKARFLQRLEEKNPVLAYRFGASLDDKYLLFQDGRAWTREERENPERDAEGAVV